MNGRAQRLHELVRRELTADVPAAVDRRSLGQLRARLARPTGSTWLRLSMVAAAAAVALVVAERALRIDFVVADGSASSDGVVHPSEGREARVTFSDGTEVVLARGARGRVAELGVRGARVVVEDGRADVHVRKRTRARWAFVAGPYVIEVTGTAFGLRWSVDRDRLELDLHEGSVFVRGPLGEAGVPVSAGQRLVASPRTHELRVEAMTAPVPAMPEAPVVEPSPMTIPTPKPRPLAPAPLGAQPWAARIASGDYHGVLADARKRGIARVLSHGTTQELAALADAARYAGDRKTARASLLAQRRRFVGTPLSHEAAFFLGRFAQDGDRDHAAAIRWYDAYLRGTRGEGSFATEALGRRMISLHEKERRDDACADARAYLAREPGGPYARVASDLCR